MSAPIYRGKMPSYILVHNLDRKIKELPHIEYCDRFICRLRGMMFRPHLSPHEGMLLVIAKDSRIDTSIHMLFVSFDLAVFWIDSDMQVVDKVVAKPWRLAYFPRRAARYVLEIHSTRFGDYSIGDNVEFQHA